LRIVRGRLKIEQGEIPVTYFLEERDPTRREGGAPRDKKQEREQMEGGRPGRELIFPLPLNGLLPLYSKEEAKPKDEGASCTSQGEKVVGCV